MSKLKFRINFYYKNSKEVVPNFEYRISTTDDVIKFDPKLADKWNPQGMSFNPKKTNSKGQSEPFEVSGLSDIKIYGKGEPLLSKGWVHLRTIKVNEAYISLKTIEHQLHVEIPVFKLGKAQTSVKGTSNHKSDYYQVQKGDSLGGIAERFKKDIDQLMKNNNMKNPNNIHVGQKIYIGEKNKAEEIAIKAGRSDDFLDATYKVKEGDTLGKIAEKFKLKLALIAMQNNIPLADMDKLKVGSILKIKKPKERIVDTLQANNKFSINKGLAITQYKPPKHKAKQISVSISGDLLFIGGALDIGVAYDDSGDWMLFVSTSAGGEIDPSKVPHLATGVDTQKLAELVNNREKFKQSIKKDINASIGSSAVNVEVKHVSDLIGRGLTVTNTVNVGAYSISRVHTSATVEDVDANGNKASRKIKGDGFLDNINIGAQKVKKVVDGKPISITHSVHASYTIPIFLYNRNEKLMKMQGKGIEYVD